MAAALAVFDFDKTLSSIETERRHVGAGKSADVIVDTVFGGAARAAGVKALVAEMRREGAVVKVLFLLRCLTSLLSPDRLACGVPRSYIMLLVLFGGVLLTCCHPRGVAGRHQELLRGGTESARCSGDRGGRVAWRHCR